MAQLKNVVEPFGEVNVHTQPDGSLRVWASILMEPDREGTQTGIALDGSGSMRKLYGQDTGGGVLSPIFAKPKVENIVTPVAQQLCAYLARKIDADVKTHRPARTEREIDRAQREGEQQRFRDRLRGERRGKDERSA